VGKREGILDSGCKETVGAYDGGNVEAVDGEKEGRTKGIKVGVRITLECIDGTTDG
jgi:hypothetical protein